MSRLAFATAHTAPTTNRLRRRKRCNRYFRSFGRAERCSHSCSAHDDSPVAFRWKWLSIAQIDRTLARHA